MDSSDFRSWLIDLALPLWWSNGVDRAGWGFHESLDARARPVAENRRCRVQARQIFAFVEGARLGWRGDARAAIEIGFSALNRVYRRTDGLYRTVVSPSGAVVDERAKLYDQAFILLALAAAQDMRPGSEPEALDLLDAIERKARIAPRGLAEFEERAFLANPLMHLFEAAQAWTAVGRSPRWRQLTADICDLALDRLIDAETGHLHEAFDADWRPLTGPDGETLEPGHHFEWAWLLLRWGLATGHTGASRAARRLHAAGRHGLLAGTNLAADTMNRHGIPLGGRARLWPQTERLKSATLLAATCDDSEAAAHYRGDAAAALSGLAGYYLAVEMPGLWRDKFVAGTGFVDEPSPASTLYHLVAAANQLAAVA